MSLAGCSAIKFGYDRLDWLASWEVERFVELHPPQKQLFDARFRQAWAWHRRTQLPLYAHDLRELASAVGAPLQPVQIEQWVKRSQDHATRTLQQIVPGTAAILRTFDATQVKDLLDTMADRRRDQAKRTAKLTQEELRDTAEDEMVHALKPWIGSLTADEKQRVHAWSRERRYAGTLFQQYQDAWASAFTQVLEHRAEPDFEAHLAEFFDHGRVPYGEDMQRLQDYNRRVWTATMADLSAMLTAGQRAKFQKRLRELADDLTELSTEPVQAAGSDVIG